jgi:hypothetical protein
MTLGNSDVRYSLKSGHWLSELGCLLCATCGLVQCNNDKLFDHLVRPDEQDRRDFDIERSGCPQVDHQIEPGRQHDG